MKMKMKMKMKTADDIIMWPQAFLRRRSFKNIVLLYQSPIPEPSPPPADESMADTVADVQRILDYTFSDPGLLVEALTHSSHSSLPSYQRLELVGDATINLAFTNFFFLNHPELGPGPLSVLRAANISTEKLARVAVRHGFYLFLRRNSPKLDVMVDEFSREVIKEQEEDCSETLYGGDTLKAPKVLADIVESIAGAIYVDCNLDLEKFWKVFRGILEPIITWDTMDEQPVTTLYELCQKQGISLNFKNWKKDNTNTTQVFVDGRLVGSGTSEQKVIAKLNAARDALQKLPRAVPTSMESDSGVIVVEEKAGPKQKLNDLCIKKRWRVPIYRIEKEKGPAHGKKFICSVKVVTPKMFAAVGEERSRVKDAENAAAAKMLSKLEPYL